VQPPTGVTSTPTPNMEAIHEEDVESNSTHRQSDNQQQRGVHRRKDAEFHFFKDARREVVQVSKSDPTPEIAKLETQKNVELVEI